MELHVRMVACISLSAIGAQGEVAVNVVQWGSRVIVKGAMELGLLVSLNLLSVITRSHHNDITRTKGFHDLVFDTVNSLYLQLNLRMSEIHTFQLQQGHIHIGSAQCTVVGCISYCLNPFWLSLAQRRARVISDPCSLTPTLAQPFHNPVSVPFFRLCLWICVGSCSLVGTWLRESQSTHTHIKPNKVRMRHRPWQSDLTLQSALPRHGRPHTLCIACKVACTFSPPSASTCSSHS